MDPTKPKTKLSRASTHKVRTGCVTCKTRRIKCDEAKPHCRNCLNRSVFCGGYLDTLAKKKSHIVAYQHCWDSKQPPRGPSPVTQPAFGSGPQSLEDTIGHLYFQEFVNLVQSPWTAAALHKDLWEVTLPQLTYQHPALCHAAMAIGAMSTWHRQTCSGSLSAGQNPTPSGHEGDKRYIRALSHFSHSINLQSGQTSMAGAIFLSFLFIIFETLRGNRKTALDHVNHGLTLLVSLLADEDGQHHVDTFAPNPKPLLRAVADILIYLGIQGQSILRGRIGDGPPLPNFKQSLVTRRLTIQSFNLLVERLDPCSVELDNIPRFFSTLDEFESYWAAAHRQCRALNPILLDAVHSSGVLDLGTPNPMHRFAQHLEQNQQLGVFCQHNKRLAKTLDDAFLPLFNTIISSDVEYRTYVRALQLRLQCFGSLVFESPQDFVDIRSLAARTNLFKQYLSFADIALRAASHATENPAYSISMQSDLTWRLFVVTLFCRDPLVREEAIWKLRSCSGHDGLWNTRSLYALGLRNKAVESANAIEGSPDEQWERLWHREYVFEEGCNRIILRYLEKNQLSGEWELVEEAAVVDGLGDNLQWMRQIPIGFGRPLMSILLGP